MLSTLGCIVSQWGWGASLTTLDLFWNFSTSPDPLLSIKYINENRKLITPSLWLIKAWELSNWKKKKTWKRSKKELFFFFFFLMSVSTAVWQEERLQGKKILQTFGHSGLQRAKQHKNWHFIFTSRFPYNLSLNWHYIGTEGQSETKPWLPKEEKKNL